MITILPSQQHAAGTTVPRVQGTAVNLPARKEIDTAAKGWSAFVDGLPGSVSSEGALLETVTPCCPRLHLLTCL